jgi:hypothetical protein
MRQDDAVPTILVLTESALLPHDVERLQTLYGDSDRTIHVCVPSQEGDSPLDVADEVMDDVNRTEFSEIPDDVSGDDRTPVEVRQRAQRHLAASVADLAAAGLTADGELVPESPADRVVELAVERDAVEILVITSPHWLDEVLRRDWATRIYKTLKHEHQEIPVLHFIAGTDTVVKQRLI